MKMIGWTSLLPMAMMLGRYSVVGQTILSEETQEPQRRTYMTVEYDYKLEANASSVDLGENSTTTARNPLDEALFQIDSNMIASIQSALPAGRSITEDKTTPDIEFDTVSSRLINICFTESDGCRAARLLVAERVGNRGLHAFQPPPL